MGESTSELAGELDPESSIHAPAKHPTPPSTPASKSVSFREPPKRTPEARSDNDNDNENVAATVSGAHPALLTPLKASSASPPSSKTNSSWNIDKDTSADIPRKPVAYGRFVGRFLAAEARAQYQTQSARLKAKKQRNLANRTLREVEEARPTIPGGPLSAVPPIRPVTANSHFSITRMNRYESYEIVKAWSAIQERLIGVGGERKVDLVRELHSTIIQLARGRAVDLNGYDSRPFQNQCWAILVSDRPSREYRFSNQTLTTHRIDSSKDQRRAMNQRKRSAYRKLRREWEHDAAVRIVGIAVEELVIAWGATIVEIGTPYKYPEGIRLLDLGGAYPDPWTLERFEPLHWTEFLKAVCLE